MRRKYLFIYSNVIGDRDTVKAILDSITEVVDWRFDIPNSFYLISDLSAQDLVDKIHSCIKTDSCRFFVTEISGNHQGYLPKDTWNFLNS